MSQIYLGGNGKNEYIIWADSQGQISDGYHTFEELYDHRHILTCFLLMQYKHIAFKTKKNSHKEEWSGWFIAGLNTEFGQISYHLPIKYWDMLPVQEIVYNDRYDDHTSFDVLKRLVDLFLSASRTLEAKDNVLCDSNDCSGGCMACGFLAQEEEFKIKLSTIGTNEIK